MTYGLDQHNRTRMTYSLEVAQIAKSIARPLKLNTDLVEAIAVGHNVWVVKKILAGRRDLEGMPYPGFNLKHDVVEGIWKHTNIDDPIHEFDELKNYKPENKKGSLEAQIVNIADSVAYIRHDIEDAIQQGMITYEQFRELWHSSELYTSYGNMWSVFF